MLKAKDNFLEAIKFGRPEYVPYSRRMPVVTIGFFGVNPDDNRPEGADTWTDLWQVRHRHEQEGMMPFPVFHPLEKLPDWDDYVWPDPHELSLYVQAREKVGGIARRSEILLSGSHRSTLLERAWKLVGMENLFMMMLNEPERIHWLFDRIIEFQLGVAEEYVALGVEMAALGDDHGTQLAPLFSPELFRQFYKPRYRRLIDFYKSKGCLIGFHSCGNIADLIPDFIDLGIDILNPVQATANDLARVRNETQGKMALLGAISTATILDGPVERIRREARARIVLLGRQGGYICGPDQGMPYPEKNIDALEQAVAEFGRYPLPKA